MPPLIRQISLYDGTPNARVFGYITVGQRVGPGARNDSWDVMLVQAMLGFLWPDERGTPDSEAPLPTGGYDKLTARAIHNFQKRHGLEADWYVDPLRITPSGIMVRGHSLIWTMAKLNISVRDQASLLATGPILPVMEVLRVLENRFPQLADVAMMMRDELEFSNVF